jgi:3-(3-hydroxy-phenyl)propionate hydroxylase
MTNQQYDADVIIIGYGPSGVSAANFLGSRGVKTIAIERWTDIYSRARAVTVNDWTLRCYQSVGLDEALKAGMDVTLALQWKTYDGQVLRNVIFPPGNIGHATSYAIYQPAMEQTLRDGAARYANVVDVRFGQAMTKIVQDADGVTVTATDGDTGATSTIRARYALACDGGSSGTREQLGIELLGDTLDTRWVVIDARVKRWWPNRHVLTHWSDAKRPMVDITLAQGNHRWELPLAPHESEDDFQTHEQLWGLLGMMGVTDEHVEIHQHAFYSHHVRHAERWREGRVFLVGDAAHMMPPWAGQGMQSGIRDADNLSWKLAEVIAGRLPDAVLDSYEAERAPDVEKYTQLSAMLGRLTRREMAAEDMPPQSESAKTTPGALPAIGAGWLTGGTGPDSAVGKMIPQPEMFASNGKSGLLDNLIGNGFVLMGDNVDPASLLTAEQRAGWDGLGARYFNILTPDQASHDDTDLIDIYGTLLGWMRPYGARVVAVRPDRFVAATDVGGLDVPGTGGN